MSRVRFLATVVITASLTWLAMHTSGMVATAHAQASKPAPECRKDFAGRTDEVIKTNIETWMASQIASGRTNFFTVGYWACAW